MMRAFVAAIVAVPYLAALLPAYAIAGLLRLFATTVAWLAQRLERPFVPWTELMAFEPRLGWKPRPHLDTHYLADFDDVFSIVTDGDGWPGRRSLERSDVVVIGDSFAFGYGVDAGRSFADLDARLRVKAIGAPGYSMVQGVLLMEQLAARLHGKSVIWFVCLENDLQDNLVPELRRHRAPFARRDVVTGQWGIAHDHVTAKPWTCSDQDPRRLFPRMCVPGPLADRAYSACDYLIERANTACRAHDVQLAIVTVPDPRQLTVAGRAELARCSGAQADCDASLPDRRLADICALHDVLLVAGATHLTRHDYKRREGIHWNGRGHRRMAGVVRRVADALRSAASVTPIAPNSAAVQKETAHGHSPEGLDLSAEPEYPGCTCRSDSAPSSSRRSIAGNCSCTTAIRTTGRGTTSATGSARTQRIHAWQGPREGTPGSWTPCVREARGEFVYIATSDDTMAPDCLARMVAALDAHPECDIAHCALRPIDGNGDDATALAHWWRHQSAFARSSGSLLTRPHIREAPFDGLLHLLGDSVYVSITQLLIRRSLFDRIGLFQRPGGRLATSTGACAPGCRPVPCTCRTPGAGGGCTRARQRQASPSARPITRRPSTQ